MGKDRRIFRGRIEKGSAENGKEEVPSGCSAERRSIDKERDYLTGSFGAANSSSFLVSCSTFVSSC
jgi:hypothetical protein